MDAFDSSVVATPVCCTVDGRGVRVGLAKRNGRPTPLLSPVWTEGGPPADPSYPWLDDSRYYINLNSVERRTWRQLLSGTSINAIADEEGVSRAAIYARIEGNRCGHGGMLAKNFWCLLWWRLRRRRTGNPQ